MVFINGKKPKPFLPSYARRLVSLIIITLRKLSCLTAFEEPIKMIKVNLDILFDLDHFDELLKCCQAA